MPHNRCSAFAETFSIPQFRTVWSENGVFQQSRDFSPTIPLCSSAIWKVAWTQRVDGRSISIVDWAIINALCLIAPLILLWGWITYLRIPTRSDWRSRVTLAGLSAPLLSVGLWIATLFLARIEGWHTSHPAIQRLITLGVWIPIIGMLVGLAGRPRLILAIIPASVATVFFWYGTTLP
jgi:hypothetical protein